MRVLCAVGQRGGPELIERLATLLNGKPELLLLHVVDTGPRHDLEHLVSPLRHGPLGGPGRQRQLNDAEESAAKSTLEETLAAARKAGFSGKILRETGKPERAIMRIASDEGVSLIAIWAHEGAEGQPHIGPASVGHTARFVLDHAPCDVLLLREVN